MAKHKKSKKKNPKKNPRVQNQNRSAQNRPAQAKTPASGGKSGDAKRQQQLLIALAIAVGVFLLLLLVSYMTRQNNATDGAETADTETVQEAETATTDDADTESDTDGATAADNADTTDAADNADTTAATADNADTTDVTTTSADSGASDTAAPADNADTAAATTDDGASQTATDATSSADAAATTTADNGASETAATPAAVQYADILVQDYGTITVELDPSAAPITVQNFVDLAKSNFYNGLTFHRIMDGFMIQGGDPKGNGTGGSDKEIVGEFTQNGHDNPLSHTRGTISMARATPYDSASSQFFIMQADNTTLDGLYAAFGHVTSGMEVVDQICKDAHPIDDNGTIPADEQPIIESITIREN